ncbi:Manganese transport system ATP-binding protein MntB [Rubrobacter xylanophilus DSM 9941]|uniref:metal ABC transporter ATP-binding protein n=1 Tax=Rubrobacter xylanophilus TaxID=49319 RepID=UPI001C64211C|nr:metal ABC transporter ATP-binding protein [Rubrobacter xylanophilus]QYJ14383.1 Manganese transport system ATP-binding protein MntB [Rubrobacter xylanophilus DSM 9941]
MEKALEIRDLTVVYGGRPAIEGAELELPRGAMLGVVGPNGGGKSTLLRAVLGMAPVVRGEVRVLGRRLDRRARRLIGYVPQREDVDWDFPVSAFDVVMMGRVPSMGLLRRPSELDRELVWKALEVVGMDGLAGKRIGEFSGGQQQRIFLARALAQEAEILLLDEPVSGVDAPSQHEIFDLLRGLQERGRTIVVTTHDLSCVAERFDLALLLNRRVVAYGPPAEVFVPELLNETYQSHLMILRVGDRTVALETDRPGDEGD